MTMEIYLGIALLQMGHDAMQTYNAKMRYRVVSSLMLALLWPLTNAIMVAGVVIRQRPNIALCKALGDACIGKDVWKEVD